MRISKEKAVENRGKVVTAAARLLRERGLDGVGIDAVADAAGLTHGAVYSHFKSKNELAAEAVRQALHQSMDEWLALTRGLAGADALRKAAQGLCVARASRSPGGRLFGRGDRRRRPARRRRVCVTSSRTARASSSTF